MENLCLERKKLVNRREIETKKTQSLFQRHSQVNWAVWNWIKIKLIGFRFKSRQILCQINGESACQKSQMHNIVCNRNGQIRTIRQIACWNL